MMKVQSPEYVLQAHASNPPPTCRPAAQLCERACPPEHCAVYEHVCVSLIVFLVPCILLLHHLYTTQVYTHQHTISESTSSTYSLPYHVYIFDYVLKYILTM